MLRGIACMHVTAVSSKCFFQLLQVHPSLHYETVAVLVHALITSRVDYSNCLLAGALKSTTKKLQRVMNAATRLIVKTQKFVVSRTCGATSFTGWTSGIG